MVLGVIEQGWEGGGRKGRKEKKGRKGREMENKWSDLKPHSQQCHTS